MSRPWVSDRALLVVAQFSRHPDALDWSKSRLVTAFGPVSMASEVFSFHHTSYYEASMGRDLLKQLLVFDAFYPKGELADAKIAAIAIEREFAGLGRFSEPRPLNLDPGLLQLGKFVLATTKDQSHRIYLRDEIYAEVTLRFRDGLFEPWPWTYADYREPAVLAFLGDARRFLAEKIRTEKRP